MKEGGQRTIDAYWEEDDEDEDFFERKMNSLRDRDYGVPDVASVMNDESMGDGEYVARVLRPPLSPRGSYKRLKSMFFYLELLA